MEFMNKQQDPRSDISSVVSIVEDEVMGRCLEAQQQHVAGSIIFTDKAVILSSNNDEDESDENDVVERKYLSFINQLYNNNNNKKKKGKKEKKGKKKKNNKTEKKISLQDIKKFVNVLVNHDSNLVQSIDMARNFLQGIEYLLMYDKKNDQDVVEIGQDVDQEDDDFVLINKQDVDQDVDTSANVMKEVLVHDTYSLIQQLQPVKHKQYTQLIAYLRTQQQQDVLPPESLLSNEEAGRVLGVMNNNQLQLEMFEGSGIFAYACIIQHDCQPSCSFSSSLDGTTCYITALRDMNAGMLL